MAISGYPCSRFHSFTACILRCIATEHATASRAEYSFGRGGSENHDDRVTHKIQDIALPGIDDFKHFFQLVVEHTYEISCVQQLRDFGGALEI